MSEHAVSETGAGKPPRDAWAQWISPETLISQVRNTAPFLEARLPAAEPGRLIELGHSPDGFLRILANWQNILRAGLTPRGATPGLLRALPGLPSRDRRHVRAHRCRYQDPRHRVARIARPRGPATHAAPGPRGARLDRGRHLDPRRSRRQRPQRRAVERHRGRPRTPAGTRRHGLGGRSAGRHRSGDRSRTGGLRRRWPRSATPNSTCCASP